MSENKVKRGSWRERYNRFRENPFVRFVALWAGFLSLCVIAIPVAYYIMQAPDDVIIAVVLGVPFCFLFWQIANE